MSIVKLIHIILIFIWMGTLLTLTRLVDMLKKEDDSIQKRMLQIYKRVYLLVDLPSMLGSICLSFLLIFLKGANFKAGWFHMKMTFALLLIISDLLFARCLFKNLKIPRLQYKIIHGCVGLFLIGVLSALYIMKPQYESAFSWQKKSDQSIMTGQNELNLKLRESHE